MKNFFADLKERFMKFDTIHGLYKIPLGVLLIFISLDNLPYWRAVFEYPFILNDMGLFIGARSLVEGLHNLLGNPVKAKAALNVAVAKHTASQNNALAPSIPPQ